jgi:hypothetical protein
MMAIADGAAFSCARMVSTLFLHPPTALAR